MTKREHPRERRRARISRPDRPSAERSLDALLDGFPEAGPRPDEDLARWQPAARVLAALTSAPESSELAGEAQALEEFRARARHVQLPAPVRRRSPGRAGSLRGARPAAATGAVLMGGLLAVAYAGDLPAAAQRLAHDTIDAPAAGRAGPAGPRPDGSGQPVSPAPATARQGRSASGHGSAGPDRRVFHGSPSGFPRHHWRSRSAPGTEPGQPGSPGQSGSPSDSPTPGPTQQPSPSASSPPQAGATPSPSATPSTTRRPGHQRRPAAGSTQSAAP